MDRASVSSSEERSRPVTAEERLRALVDSLPRCGVCDEGATHRSRQDFHFCREHSFDGCSELPWAKALEAAL